MEPMYNVVCKTKNRDGDGKNYNKWFKIGIAGQADNGKLCFKLDSLPIGFDGWCYLADLREDE